MNTTVATDLENTTDEIPSLLVPMVQCKLVLPTVSVAEMIPYQPPKARQPVVFADIPDWYLGSLAWRGVMVPMISYELLNGDPSSSVLPESQLIVLNNTGVSARLPFVSFPTQGIPRLSRVAANEILENKEHTPKPYEEMTVSVAGEYAAIPSVSEIEIALVRLLGY